MAKKIEKISRFLLVNTGSTSSAAAIGPRIVMVSLPRVKWIEDSNAPRRYYLEHEITEERVAADLGVPVDRIHYLLNRDRTSA